MLINGFIVSVKVDLYYVSDKDENIEIVFVFFVGFGCSGLWIWGGNRWKNNCSRGLGEIIGILWSIERISNLMCML